MQLRFLNYTCSKIELVVGVAALARLLLYFWWDKIDLVGARKLITNFLQDGAGDLKDYVVELVRGLEHQIWLCLEEKFGITHLCLTMEEISKTFWCGMGTNGGTLLSRLHVDNACVLVTGGQTNSTVYSVFSQVSECFTCSPMVSWQSSNKVLVEEINASNSFQVNTNYLTYLEVRENGSLTSSCSTEYHFEQYGLYRFSLDDCSVSVQDKPVNAYLPLLWAFIILCMLAGLRLTYQAIYKTSAFRRFLVWVSLRTERQNDLVAQYTDSAALLEINESAPPPSRRLRSLDSFRGLSISVMIFVNYGGGSYYFFNHSPWNGLTVADLVFPWFIWIMGVSLAISTQSQLRGSQSRIRIFRRVLVRSCQLFLLGLVINSEGGRNDLRKLRIPGVLQRFGVSYLVVATAEAFFMPREYPPPDQRGRSGIVLDISSAWIQWLLTFLLGGVHALVTFVLPVPGCPSGYLGPGGLADNSAHYNCTGGAAMWVDVSVFGTAHIYQYPTCQAIYQTTTPHDPEGLLGCLNSVVLVWLGVAAGRVLLVHADWQARLKRWLCYAVVCGLLAASLAGFSKNEGIIPINKNLWSLSFILATAAMAFFLLSVMYTLIDVFKFWSGSPLYYPGMNSIVLYLGHEMCSGMIPWSWKPFTESHSELLAMNLWGASLWVLASYFLYRNKIFFAL